jgi:hypothetical protein
MRAKHLGKLDLDRAAFSRIERRPKTRCPLAFFGNLFR